MSSNGRIRPTEIMIINSRGNIVCKIAVKLKINIYIYLYVSREENKRSYNRNIVWKYGIINKSS